MTLDQFAAICWPLPCLCAACMVLMLIIIVLSILQRRQEVKQMHRMRDDGKRVLEELRQVRAELGKVLAAQSEQGCIHDLWVPR